MASKKKSARSKAPATRSKPRAQPARSVHFHERSPNGQHRIVAIKDQTTVTGSWTPYEGIAIHGKYRATTEHFLGVLPTGLFTTSSFAAAKVDG